MWQTQKYNNSKYIHVDAFVFCLVADCVNVIKAGLVRRRLFKIIIEPRHEKTCFRHMRTTKVQISLRILAVWSATFDFAT